MSKRLLLIGGRHNIVESAKKLDFEVILFENKGRLQEKTIKLADETYIIDWEDHEKVVQLASAIHLNNPIDAVIAFGEKRVKPAALVKESLGVTGNPLLPVELASNKYLMRKRLNSLNISPVKYEYCLSKTEIKDKIKNVGFPAIIKPVNGTASVAINKIQDEHHLDVLLNNIELNSLEDHILIEEYLDGKEYSVEGITLGGKHFIIGITEKFTTGDPHFVETGHQFPAKLSEEDEKEIYNLVIKTLDAIGHELGPTHTEIKLTSNGPKIIETHTRPGGDNITELIKLSYGIDVFYTTLKYLADLDVSINRNLLEYSGISYFIIPEGQIFEINGLEYLQNDPNIVDFNFEKKVGEIIYPAKNSFSRHGYVMFTAYSKDKLDKIVKCISDKFIVRTKNINSQGL